MSQPYVMYAIPTFGTVNILWAQARSRIAQPLGTVTIEQYDNSNTDIATKRNNLVYSALNQGVKHILFWGDDVLFDQDTLLKFRDKRERLGVRVITGIYFSKGYPTQPMIWMDYLNGCYYDWHIGDFFKIGWAGCDCLFVDMDVFKEIEPPWFSLDYNFNQSANPIDMKRCIQTGTEDLYFYTKLKQAGIDVWCDAGIQCGHVDRETGCVYGLPSDWPQAKPGSEIPRKNGLLIADIGCGYRINPLQLDGDIVRFDLNPYCKPDVLCDVSCIPELPDKYDMVCASHVLEHVGGNKAIQTVQEWTRILKPGGILWIRVPNIEVPCRHIIQGTATDYHHMMIYGLQCEPGQYHKNGFTPAILKNLIEKAGNLEITELTLEPHPELDAEISLKAKKLKSLSIPILENVWKKEENDVPRIEQQPAAISQQ